MNKCILLISGCVVGLFIVVAALVGAANVPMTLSYQGTLTDKTGQPLNGTKEMTFSLYTQSSGGSAFWTETQSVPITSGQFSVVFGKNSSNPLDNAQFTGETFVGVKVETDLEMTQRQQLTSVAYALKCSIETAFDAHEASTAEHGVTGETVGTANVQTLTNKTLAGPTITAPTIRAWDGWQSVSDSWTYVAADSPTFTITVPSGAASIYGVGMRIKLTQTTVKYFIIIAVADTVLTVYGGTDYTLANSAISSIYYSMQKSPLGFPINPDKWSVISSTSGLGYQENPVQGVWYNLGSWNIALPIGVWQVSYQVLLGVARSGDARQLEARSTLSTTNSTESDKEFSTWIYSSANASYLTAIIQTVARSKIVTVTSKTTYYMNVQAWGEPSVSGVYFRNDDATGIIKAVCAYL